MSVNRVIVLGYLMYRKGLQEENHMTHIFLVVLMP